MFRTSPWFAVLTLFLLPAGVRAQAGDAEGPEISIKVSLSREDPDVHLGDWSKRDPLELYVFVDGAPNRGAEFGLDVQGAKFLSFVIDSSSVWLSMPMRDPYPGTIAQVVVGPDCLDPPTYFGKILLLPDEPGGRIVVDVIPSLRANAAVAMDCENLGMGNVRAFPATVNGGDAKPARSHALRGD